MNDQIGLNERSIHLIFSKNLSDRLSHQNEFHSKNGSRVEKSVQSSFVHTKISRKWLFNPSLRPKHHNLLTLTENHATKIGQSVPDACKYFQIIRYKLALQNQCYKRRGIFWKSKEMVWICDAANFRSNFRVRNISKLSVYKLSLITYLTQYGITFHRNNDLSN